MIRKCATCKILIVPEEGWFGQPKYSTSSKKTFYVVSVFCRKLNSERLTVRLELTVSYFVFHFQGTAWLVQEMFTITTEKRRYYWNNQDESLYSITTVDRCTKLINNKITKIEIKYRPWIFFWISTYETSHSFQPRSPITTHMLLRPKLHITRRWTRPITIVDTTSLFSKKKSNEFTVHCNVFSQLQTFPIKEVMPCLTKYWKKVV